MDFGRQAREGLHATTAGEKRCAMTIDEAMAKATAAIDEAIAAAMDDGIALLVDKGGTDEELESFREWYAQMLATDRATNLANVRSWLEREGSTLQ